MPVPGRKAYERRHFNDSILYQQHQPEVDNHRIRAFGVPSRSRRISSEPDRLERAVPFYRFEYPVPFYGFEDPDSLHAVALYGFEDSVTFDSIEDPVTFYGFEDPVSFYGFEYTVTR